MNNLTLYVKTGCPYCAATIHKLEELRLKWDEKNVSDPAVVEELIKRGGRKQEPYLVDSATGIEMYESDNIIEYLEDTYGKGKVNEDVEAVKPKEIKEDGTCEI